MVVKLFCGVYVWLVAEALGGLVAWYEWRSPGNMRHSIYIFIEFVVLAIFQFL